MTSLSNGGSFTSNFGESGGSVATARPLRWPPPTWKFGIRPSGDRGYI